MSFNLDSVFRLILAGALWGGTNPLLKKSCGTQTQIVGGNSLTRLCREFFSLVTNWKYILPFLLNQTGSLFYFLTLQNTDISLAVPVANSLTFVFTAISGWLLGEEKPNSRMLAGMVFVIVGISLCVLDKAVKIDESQG